MFQSHVPIRSHAFSSEGLTMSIQGTQISQCWKSVLVVGLQQGECISRRPKRRQGAENAQEWEQKREDKGGLAVTSPSKLERLSHLMSTVRATHPEVGKKGPFLILKPTQCHQPKLHGPCKKKHTGDVVKAYFVFRNCQHIPFTN